MSLSSQLIRDCYNYGQLPLSAFGMMRGLPLRNRNIPANRGFKLLPHDVFLLILSYLTRKDLSRTFFVDAYWQQKTVQYAKQKEIHLVTAFFQAAIDASNRFSEDQVLTQKLKAIPEILSLAKAQTLAELGIALMDLREITLSVLKTCDSDFLVKLSYIMVHVHKEKPLFFEYLLPLVEEYRRYEPKPGQNQHLKESNFGQLIPALITPYALLHRASRIVDTISQDKDFFYSALFFGFLQQKDIVNAERVALKKQDYRLEFAKLTIALLEDGQREHALKFIKQNFKKEYMRQLWEILAHFIKKNEKETCKQILKCINLEKPQVTFLDLYSLFVDAQDFEAMFALFIPLSAVGHEEMFSPFCETIIQARKTDAFIRILEGIDLPYFNTGYRRFFRFIQNKERGTLLVCRDMIIEHTKTIPKNYYLLECLRQINEKSGPD
jgi:hypothetical protein